MNKIKLKDFTLNKNGCLTILAVDNNGNIISEFVFNKTFRNRSSKIKKAYLSICAKRLQKELEKAWE